MKAIQVELRVTIGEEVWTRLIHDTLANVYVDAYTACRPCVALLVVIFIINRSQLLLGCGFLCQVVEDVVRLVLIETHESENEGAELRLSDHRVNRTTELLTDDNEQVVRAIEILSFTNKECAANSCVKYFIFWLLELSLDLLVELLQILIDNLDLLLVNLVCLSL